MSIRQEGTAVLWAGTVDEEWFLCESLDQSPQADADMTINGAGDTVGGVYFDDRQTLNLSIVPLADISEEKLNMLKNLKPGEMIALHDVFDEVITCRIESASMTRTSRVKGKVQITAIHYPRWGGGPSVSDGA